MSFSSFWDNFPADGQVVRCTTPNQAGIFGAGANDSSILGGPITAAGTHVVNSPCSSIVMGVSNTINAAAAPAPDGFNTIVNGGHNTVSGYFNSIYGGGHGANHS